VDTPLMLLDFVGVADRAVHSFDDRRAGPVEGRIGLRVALSAPHRSKLASVRYYGPVRRRGQLPGVHGRQRSGRPFDGVDMARHAVLVADAVVVVDLPGFVRLMAVDADGDFVWSCLPEFSVDNLAMDLLDEGMTLRAGAHDVVAVNGGPGIRMGQDIVGRMTTGAYGRDRQSFFEDTLTMDALLVVLKNVVLRDVSSTRYWGVFGVTSAARSRDIDRGRLGLGVVWPSDIVLAMAVPAMRRQRVAVFNRHAVEALGILVTLVMTSLALRRLKFLLMGQLLDVVVARHASLAGVDRFREHGLVDVDRPLLAVRGFCTGVGFPVTEEALLVVLSERRADRQEERCTGDSCRCTSTPTHHDGFPFRLDFHNPTGPENLTIPRKSLSGSVRGLRVCEETPSVQTLDKPPLSPNTPSPGSACTFHGTGDAG